MSIKESLFVTFPRPWRLLKSKGGQHFIYANGHSMPISKHLKLNKSHTEEQRAVLELIVNAVNVLED